jgi:phosphate:Na+ symporter
MTRRRLRRTTEEYFGRARINRAENIEMGKLLLDIVRDLKRVNAHLAAAAYLILEGRAANCCQAG